MPQLYYNSGMMLMGIDFGEKRVGIASTDESGRFALPRMVLENNAELASKIKELVAAWQIEKVVIGESKNFRGEHNPIHEQAERFARELQDAGMETIFHPEMLTSMEAARLQGGGEMLDASAAAIILKSYIDTHL